MCGPAVFSVPTHVIVSFLTSTQLLVWPLSEMVQEAALAQWTY